MDLDRYLARIGFDGPIRADRETLAGIMRAHMHRVPFENLDIHRGVPLSLDFDDLFDKIVDRQRGGFCYELNGLLSAALDEIGFVHTLLSCRVITGDRLGPEFDHLALAVRIDDDTYLVDVGFGEGIRQPMKLSSGASETTAGYRRWIERRDGMYAMVQENGSGEHSGFLIDDTPRALSEFHKMCRYHETSPESPFTNKPLCTLAQPSGRITLSGDILTRTEHGEKISEMPLSELERAEALREYFGITLTL